ncbi:porphobilinogen deaminase, dipyromethane cofactor binding domain-containing protein [Lentinula aciculospora]|uniref:Porphobilinogen deaminase n=1 Tax=Lentinula aciculospora TaxID=153920 RepID=A0A9W9DU37_9AGAR|nr:porphobilinogen deaminase, dipyromethane cofactor binding domain-containing protein [Lentinula aciculospora]
MSKTSRTFVLASRGSQLAQIQTNIALDSMKSHFSASDVDATPKFTTSFMTTAGDKNQSQALYLLGGKALWTKELEVALIEREVDMLVHSFKDVPTVLPAGCIIAGIMEREDPVDSLVVRKGLSWKTLDDLPDGSVVGTSSVRRIAQLRRKFPKLVFQDVRGNLNTRMAKLDAPDGPFVAIILAKAGMVRLGMGDRLTTDLVPPLLYHAVSQGALAIEIRSDDTDALEICQRITHRETAWRCLAERACLRKLEGGCSVPVGVGSSLDGNVLTITGCVTALDGSKHVQHTMKESVASEQQAEDVGTRLAVTLIETGAKEILDYIIVDRQEKIRVAQEQDGQIVT